MFRRGWVLTKHAYLGFTRDDCLQLAAAIAYYVLFSIVPLAIVAVSIFGFFLNSEHARAQVVNHVLDAIPLSQTDGRSAVDRALNSVNRVSGPVAALGLLATIWTSSAVFASVRKALNRVWRLAEHRPFAQQKLIDFAQMGLLGAFLLASTILTGVLRAIRQLALSNAGPLAGPSPLWEIPLLLLPAVLTFIAFALLYRIVPAERPRWRDALPGALVATLLFEALKDSFALYVAKFNTFDVIYGSLAGALLFLLYTYLAAAILLIGAEIARTLQRYHSGEFQNEIVTTQPAPPVTTRALKAVRGLFLRQ
ncbi:MAG TPA: YihY/virulence factor BrkB family protein [Dehalococcoidia bacterium]|nr:YihY/virulence factor BrkB family protein [Dehalococcoidia bacterium]